MAVLHGVVAMTRYETFTGHKLEKLTCEQPVTITLRKGDPNDLDTIGVLADKVEGSSYLWEVSQTLEPAEYVIARA